MSIKRRLEKLEVKLLPPEPPIVYARIIIDGEAQEAGIVRWMNDNNADRPDHIIFRTII